MSKNTSGRTVRLNTNIRQRATFINVTGEIDPSTADDLHRQLFAAVGEATSVMIVRLKHVPYMDSSGVAVLLELVREARTRGKEVVVLEPSGAARRALAMVDLSALVKVYDSIDNCAQCMALSPALIRAGVADGDGESVKV